MSELPARPSLTHLRKQAKDLLRELQGQNPGVTLVEAQHALARRYGFASWPKLKAHVEAHADISQPPMFHRYTGKAREAVFFSRCEASQQGSQTIEPEHVLLGLIRATQGLASFDRLSLGSIGLESKLSGEVFDPVRMTVRVSTGHRARRVLRAAAEEADAMNHHEVGLAHILLGMMRDRDSTAAKLLEDAGIRVASVRDALAALLREDSENTAP